MLMMIVRNKDKCILNHTAPVPWPSPLTRVVSLDSLSPVLSLTDVCGSWLPPQLVTSLEPPLGPGWHPRTHILIFTYPAQEINYLDLITLEGGTDAPYSRLNKRQRYFQSIVFFPCRFEYLCICNNNVFCDFAQTPGIMQSWWYLFSGCQENKPQECFFNVSTFNLRPLNNLWQSICIPNNNIKW